MRLRPKSLKFRFAAGFLFVGAILVRAPQGSAQPAPGVSPRIALVIGESNYKTGPLSSAANDAGLVADTLQRAGFDVAGAADLDQDGLRKALREFVDKAAAAGPGAIAFVYISGRGVQYAGENYIAPIEAAIPRAANVPLEAVRLSDYLQPLAQLPLKAGIVVLDAARINTFAQSGEPLAGGLALVEPAPGGLYAFNAAPGSVAPNETGAYGVYAQALAEALRQPGLPLDEAFAQVRLRVSEVTKGAVIPWDESKLAAGAPALFARAPDAPPPVAEATMTRLQGRPIREYPVEDAFAATLERDTIQGYIDFLAVYPDSPYAPRVRAMLALRREAITWRRAYLANSPNAYWSYLRVYPHGPHAWDAQRRLATLSAPLAPPAQFDVMEFDVPPPPPDELVYFRRPYVEFDDPEWGPPPPRFGYLPPPLMIVDEPPPPPPHSGLLPLPLIVAPLVGAAVLSHMGAFHAPAVVQTQVPAAQDYYNNANRRAQLPPGSAPPSGAAAPTTPAPSVAAPRAPGALAPGAVPGGTPLPRPAAPAGAAPLAPAAPGGTPLPHPAAPVVPAAPGGTALPHAAPAAPIAPAVPAAPHVAPSTAPAAPHVVAPSVAPAAPHVVAPATPHVATPPAAAAPRVVAPAAPRPAAPAAPHIVPAAPHIAAPPAPHVAPPPAPHIAPPPAPHIAPPPAPHIAPPPAPHLAPPPAPHAAPPPAAAPHPGRPNCGGPGQPPCH
jgi:uncharacterized caspase-like protein